MTSKIVRGLQDALAYAKGDKAKGALTAWLPCKHCNAEGFIEPDNNGPIGPCPVCKGRGYIGKNVG